MYGHLIPCSGGAALPLLRTRMYLGRTVGDSTPSSLNAQNALCQLELHDGWWHLEDLRAPHGIQANGRTCKRERLQPGDEIAVGRHRFRISYETPKFGAKAKPPGTPAPAGSSRPRSFQPAEPAPPSGVLGRLVPLGGGVDFTLAKPTITFGRGSSCDIILANSKISTLHGRFDLVQGHWRVHDLGSRNGIRVDGVRCEEAWVYPSSEVSLADCRFQMEYVAQGPRPMQDMVVPRPTKSLFAQLGVSAEELSRIVASHPEEEEIPQRPRFDLLNDMKDRP